MFVEGPFPPLMHLPKRISPPEPDDSEFLLRLIAGDAEVFEQLFLAYFPELVSFARSYLRSREAAEDVVQDVFYRLWDRRSELRLRGGLAQYLYGAVRHASLDVLKHDRIAARWEAGEALAPKAAAATNEGAARIESNELAGVVTRAVASLPPRCREVFRLSRYQRLTQRDIAATLGITVNTVNVQLGRALRTIDAAIQVWEGEEKAAE
jgi:RNA polymerase sigma-70 factor, ECF subfamily